MKAEASPHLQPPRVIPDSWWPIFSSIYFQLKCRPYYKSQKLIAQMVSFWYTHFLLCFFSLHGAGILKWKFYSCPFCPSGASFFTPWVMSRGCWRSLEGEQERDSSTLGAALSGPFLPQDPGATWGRAVKTHSLWGSHCRPWWRKKAYLVFIFFKIVLIL